MSTVPHALPITARLSLALSWAFRWVVDRAIPGAVFGFVAASRGRQLLDRLGRGPSADDAEATLMYRLDVTHHVLAFVFLALITVLCLTRKSPLGQRAGFIPLLVALAGTFMMAYPATQPRTIETPEVLSVSSLLVIVGLGYTVFAVGSLGACFGLSAEARGLVTHGAYGLVRHPVYLGEFIAAIGVLLPVVAPLSLVAFALFIGLQMYRIKLEEQVLALSFAAEYAEYQQRVPMIVPWPRPTR